MEAPAPAPSRPPDRLTVGVMLALVAGLGLSFWLNLDILEGDPPSQWESIIGYGATILGGASVVGLPLLLWRRWRTPARARRRWGAGQFLWFSQGVSAWLLWPPIILKRARQTLAGDAIDPETARICYFYGTPLMAVYVLVALLAGGWIRRKRRRAAGLAVRRAGFSEVFGLWLGVLWAILGLVVLYNVYRDELK